MEHGGVAESKAESEHDLAARSAQPAGRKSTSRMEHFVLSQQIRLEEPRPAPQRNLWYDS
jgi:hypothetical protein